MRWITLAFVLASEGNCFVFGQTPAGNFTEAFDSVAPPLLPAGWTSSQERVAGVNDFTTSATAPHSPPNAVTCTNATIAQWLVSPPAAFTVRTPESLCFVIRRSASFAARVVVEASRDGGASFPVALGEAPPPTGGTAYTTVSISLPALLAGEASVYFRWRVIPDTLGATGTLRIDDVVLTSAPAFDLAIGPLRCGSLSPEEGDSIRLAATVLNRGAQSVDAFFLDVFEDINGDSLAAPDELRLTIANTAALAPRDSVVLLAALPPMSPGVHRLMGVIRSGQDQDLSNNASAATVHCRWRSHSVVINELQYAPRSGEPEWIELLNTRNDSVAIGGWAMTDAATGSRHLMPQGVLPVPPGGYTVLTKDAAAMAGTHPLLPCQVAEVPGFPSLNNSGDIVVLIDDAGCIQDSLAYSASWGGSTGGISLERVDASASSLPPGNWKPSRDLSGSTPGKRNSVARNDRDLAMAGFSATLDPAHPADSLVLEARINNPGRLAAAGYTVSFYCDENGDSVGSGTELLGVASVVQPLGPLDSAAVRLSTPSLPGGDHLLIARLDCADDDTANNTLFCSLYVPLRGATLRINEIDYAPPAGMPEWVELVNASQQTIDAKEWKLGNKGTARYGIAAGSLPVAPGSYVVLTKDTALLRSAFGDTLTSSVQVPSLPTFCWSNAGDAVVLVDDHGAAVDSVAYRPSWGGTGGKSLERIDPMGPANDSTNWCTSRDPRGATPSARNSAALLDHDLCLGLCRFVLGKDDPEVEVVVRNRGRLAGEPFRVQVYDDADRDSIAAPNERIALRSIDQSILPEDSLVILIGWHDPPCGRRMVIVDIEYAADERPSDNRCEFTANVSYSPKAVVINELMYAPLAGEGEYIELYNASAADVDAGRWSIRNRPTASGSVTQYTIPDQSRIVSPGGFLVVAADSSIFRRFAGLGWEAGRPCVVAGPGKINMRNDGDDVILCDASSAVIDSVAYLPSWHNPSFADCTGRSLERIQAAGPSSDARNWGSCVLSTGGTPGMRNSIAAVPLPPGSRLAFSPNPFSPDGDGVEDVAVIHYEVRLQDPVISIKIYDVRGRLIRRLVNNEPGTPIGDVAWNGLDDQRRKARIGIYIVFLEAVGGSAGGLETAKGALVLAGALR